MKPRTGARPGKPSGSRPFRKPSAGKPSRFSRDDRPPRDGDKKPSRFNRDERPARAGSDRKSFGDRPARPGADRKPFGDRSDRPGSDRKSFGARPFEGKRDRGFKRDDRRPAAAPMPVAVEPADDGRHIFGINPVLEALRAKSDRIEHIYIADGSLNERIAGELFSRARDLNIRVETVERERLGFMVHGQHQGVVAEVRTFDFIELEDLIGKAKASGRHALFVVLDGIQDPHNFGAIVRSAWAFGAHGVIIAKDRAAPVTAVVAKASAGAIEHCPIARVVNISRALETLKKAGVWTVAAALDGDRTLWAAPLDGPMALVVGAEGDGVRDGVKKHCDFHVKIPMSAGFDSLNASVSAGVMLAEIARQRAVKTEKALAAVKV